MTTMVDGTALGTPLRAANGLGARLNWLRAAVMGANDGIVSTAALVVGVAGAAVGSGAMLAAGVAATVAGALSMGVGEYVSVSSQRDALVARTGEGLTDGEADLTNPWYAAWASMVSFVAGALVPLLAILLTPKAFAVQVTFVAVVVALVTTGATAAHLGGASRTRAAARTVLGGVVAMAVTWGIGSLVGLQL